ncbi:MAG: TatD family hydrolase, partial [Candidatus Hydrogenedentota bacterium]
MNYVDSHAHLDDIRFDNNIEEVIKRAKENDVKYILNPSDSRESLSKVKKIAELFEIVYFAWGIHPNNIKSFTEEVTLMIQQEKNNTKLKAIGEVGLDFYRNVDNKKLQENIFREFIELALSLELPIIIHSRESDKRMHEILKSYFDGSKLYGVWHCFSGDKKLAFKVIDNGFVLGFCGNITYKNS